MPLKVREKKKANTQNKRDSRCAKKKKKKNMTPPNLYTDIQGIWKNKKCH